MDKKEEAQSGFDKQKVNPKFTNNQKELFDLLSKGSVASKNGDKEARKQFRKEVEDLVDKIPMKEVLGVTIEFVRILHNFLKENENE